MADRINAPHKVHRRAMSRRCHASKVSGVTKNAPHRGLGSSRLAAARKARSAGRNAGRDTCRRSTASSWRSTTISSSLKSDERKHRSTSAITRPNITYKNDASTSTSHHRRSQRHYGLAAIKRPIPTHDRVLAPHRPHPRVPPTRRLRTDTNNGTPHAWMTAVCWHQRTVMMAWKVLVRLLPETA